MSEKREWCRHMVYSKFGRGWFWVDWKGRQIIAEDFVKCPTCGADRNWWTREQEAKKMPGFIARIAKGKTIEAVVVHAFPENWTHPNECIVSLGEASMRQVAEANRKAIKKMYPGRKKKKVGSR